MRGSGLRPTCIAADGLHHDNAFFLDWNDVVEDERCCSVRHSVCGHERHVRRQGRYRSRRCCATSTCTRRGCTGCPVPTARTGPTRRPPRRGTRPSSARRGMLRHRQLCDETGGRQRHLVLRTRHLNDTSTTMKPIDGHVQLQSKFQPLQAT